MKITLDAAQVKLLGPDLQRAGLRVQTVAFAVLRKTALDIQADAQRLAPVRTGALRSSITVEFSGSFGAGTASAEIGPTVDYGGFVEDGTSRMAPQPYMRPALDNREGAFVAAMGKLMEAL